MRGFVSEGGVVAVPVSVPQALKFSFEDLVLMRTKLLK